MQEAGRVAENRFDGLAVEEEHALRRMGEGGGGSSRRRQCVRVAAGGGRRSTPRRRPWVREEQCTASHVRPYKFQE